MAMIPRRQQRFRLTAKQRDFRNRVIREKQITYGVLGNGSGLIYAPNSNGNRLYFRAHEGVNEAGFSSYGAAQRLPTAAGFSSPIYDGAPVVVGYDRLTERTAILAEDTVGVENAGLSNGANNPNAPERQWIRKRNIQDWISLPVGTGNTPSLKVNVGSYPYFDNYGTLQFLPATGVSTHVDLSAHVPAAAQHCLVIVWGNTFDNSYSVTASTAQDIDVPLDSTDYDECVAQTDAETMPNTAYRLKNNEGAITASAIHNDLRQLWNVPHVYGFPTLISSRKIRIRGGHQGFIQGELTIDTDGELIIESSGEMVLG